MRKRAKIVAWVVLVFFIATLGGYAAQKKNSKSVQSKKTESVSKPTTTRKTTKAGKSSKSSRLASVRKSTTSKSAKSTKSNIAKPAQEVNPITNPLNTFNPANPQRSFACKLNNMKYWVFLPKQYGLIDQEWPVVMFLHGASGRGKSIEYLKEKIQINFLNPTQEVEETKDLPFIVVAPLCPPNQYWIPTQLKGVLDEVTASCKIDSNRIYLTGHSMGAFGTWRMASTYPQLFAAIVPVSGGEQTTVVKNLVDVPTWAFHGEDDTVVSPKRSSSLVSVLKIVGGDAKLTLLPHLGHSICKEIYSKPELWEWMLSQQRESSTSLSYAGSSNP